MVLAVLCVSYSEIVKKEQRFSRLWQWEKSLKIIGAEVEQHCMLFLWKYKLLRTICKMQICLKYRSLNIAILNFGSYAWFIITLTFNYINGNWFPYSLDPYVVWATCTYGKMEINLPSCWQEIDFLCLCVCGGGVVVVVHVGDDGEVIFVFIFFIRLECPTEWNVKLNSILSGWNKFLVICLDGYLSKHITDTLNNLEIKLNVVKSITKGKLYFQEIFKIFMCFFAE